jgi:hypothetical protein
LPSSSISLGCPRDLLFSKFRFEESTPSSSFHALSKENWNGRKRDDMNRPR